MTLMGAVNGIWQNTDANAVGLEWGPRFWISTKFSKDVLEWALSHTQY